MALLIKSFSDLQRLRGLVKGSIRKDLSLALASAVARSNGRMDVYREIIQILLDAGAGIVSFHHVTSNDCVRASCLYTAIIGGNFECVKMLLESIKKRERDSKEPHTDYVRERFCETVRIAVNNGEIDIVEYALKLLFGYDANKTFCRELGKILKTEAIVSQFLYGNCVDERIMSIFLANRQSKYFKVLTDTIKNKTIIVHNHLSVVNSILYSNLSDHSIAFLISCGIDVCALYDSALENQRVDILMMMGSKGNSPNNPFRKIYAGLYLLSNINGVQISCINTETAFVLLEHYSQSDYYLRAVNEIITGKLNTPIIDLHTLTCFMELSCKQDESPNTNRVLLDGVLRKLMEYSVLDTIQRTTNVVQQYVGASTPEIEETLQAHLSASPDGIVLRTRADGTILRYTTRNLTIYRDILIKNFNSDGTFNLVSFDEGDLEAFPLHSVFRKKFISNKEYIVRGLTLAALAGYAVPGKPSLTIGPNNYAFILPKALVKAVYTISLLRNVPQCVWNVIPNEIFFVIMSHFKYG
jgi:hypothetical protein